MKALPETGHDFEGVLAQLTAAKADDYPWREGRLPLYAYWHSEPAHQIARKAYDLYFTENGQGPRAFPSYLRLHDDVVNIVLQLVRAPSSAAASLTTGGTESIFHAVKAARNRATERGIASPNLVVPRSAHPAFNKAAHILGVEERRVEVGHDFRADIAAMRTAMDANTVMIVGSAPGFPHGVFDNIERIGALGCETGVWVHVDACVGGMLSPFMRDIGQAIPDYDFAVDGVTSVSLDLHKYGYAAKGISALTVRDQDLRRYYGFEFDDWHRGTYRTPTFLGTRPAGPIASAWAVLHFLGAEGFRSGAESIARTVRQLELGIAAISGLRVIHPHELSFLLFDSEDEELDINAVAELMGERGWFVGRSVEPSAIHLMINPIHELFVDNYLSDLEYCTKAVRELGLVGTLNRQTY